jgi:hypothetical protein
VTIETGIVLEEFYRCIYIFTIWLYIANIKEDGSKFGQKNLKINSFKHFSILLTPYWKGRCKTQDFPIKLSDTLGIRNLQKH